MNPLTRYRRRRKYRKYQRRANKSGSSLREFVYLDEISVYSLLASRKGAIATEFTESETASLNSEVSGSVGGGFGGARAEIGSRIEAGQVQRSQVLRKAIVQTSFKELHELEQLQLTLRGATQEANPPNIGSLAELERKVSSEALKGWIVDPSCLRRGSLLEVEVTLEADPIFRISVIVTTIQEFMQENLQLFGADVAVQLAEIRSIGLMLESLLTGLVPVRGLLTEFRAVEISGKEWLVHCNLLAQFSEEDNIIARDVHVVGVAEGDLFWKDIRRILFSDGRYKVFCRLAEDGLVAQWRPVKLVNVLNEIHPVFGDEIKKLSETVLEAMETSVDKSKNPTLALTEDESVCISQYASLLADHHNCTLDEQFVSSLIEETERLPGWSKTVDSRRPVLAEITKRADDKWGVQTDAETACHLRDAARFDVTRNPENPMVHKDGDLNKPTQAEVGSRYLDAEIVAVYW